MAEQALFEAARQRDASRTDSRFGCFTHFLAFGVR